MESSFGRFVWKFLMYYSRYFEMGMMIFELHIISLPMCSSGNTKMPKAICQNYIGTKVIDQSIKTSWEFIASPSVNLFGWKSIHDIYVVYYPALHSKLRKCSTKLLPIEYL